MIIDFKTTSGLIYEEERYGLSRDVLDRTYLLARDKVVEANRFKTRAQGVILSDTYNNPFFPIRPVPQIDRAKSDLAEVYMRFREMYGAQKESMLPWHFFVELVGDRYHVFNTRPLDMKFPLKTDEVDIEQIIDEPTRSFLTNKIFDLSDGIHVVICGDSNVDIYTKRIYKLIGYYCISPVLRVNRLPEALYQRTFPLGLGDKFDANLLTFYIRR